MEIILAILVVVVGILDVIVSRHELRKIQEITDKSNQTVIETIEKWIEKHDRERDEKK